MRAQMNQSTMHTVTTCCVGAAPRRAFLGGPLTQRRAWPVSARSSKPPNRHFLATAAAVAEAATSAAGAVAQPSPQPEAAPAPFSWRSCWFPVVYSRDVGPKDAYPFTLLGEPIVVWRDSTGTFRAFRDACPHRLVPLSEGRIAASGNLECAYHGWQFFGDGSCTVIPQGGDISNPRACATAYQCEERQGLVWVKLQPAGEQASVDDIPVLQELEDPEWFELAPMWRDLPMDYATLIENVVDAAHVPFTHHASVSKRQSSGSFADMRITDKGAWGFSGTWRTGPRKGGLGPQETLFRGPNLMRHTIDAFGTRGFANITAVYGVPTAPGRCRLFVRQPFRFKNGLIRALFGVMPEVFSHLGNLSVLDDDNIFLHWQEREAVRHGLAQQPLGKVYFMPGPSDSYVSAFRAWLHREGGGGPFGPQSAAWLQAAGPVLPNEKLLDHYHSHTERCSICKPALSRIKALQTVAAVAAILGSIVATAAATVLYAASRLPAAASATVTPPGLRIASLAVGGAAVAVLAAAVWAWCAKMLPRFFTGVKPPPRNVVAGEWAP